MTNIIGEAKSEPLKSQLKEDQTSNSVSNLLNKSQRLLDLNKIIFDNVYEWIVVVDEKGYIIMMTKAYCNFLDTTQEEVIGKHVTEVIDNTRMHIVVKTGQREIGAIQQIRGNQMICNRIPIFEDDKIIGAVGTAIFKDIAELQAYVKKVNSMEEELDYYKKELKKALGGEYTFDHIIGNSDKILKAKKLAKKVAATKSNILLLGESGTGKELFAHAIHNASPRGDYPLIKINCAAIPSELLESELFGYEQGAFTGAKKGGKPGKFELANHSTIFLDEIGDLPLNMQAKLLRVIQEKEIERVGGVKSKKIDVRIIAATNKDLEEMVRRKQFREDLYYRLNVISIKIPSLRERKEDIPVVANYLIKKLSSEMDRHVTEISTAAMECLKQYQWPGNIRELENVIERAINLIEEEAIIMLDHLPNYITGARKDMESNDNFTLKILTEELEKKAIERCLLRTNGNKYQTAKILGISRTSLYEKMKRYGFKC